MVDSHVHTPLCGHAEGHPEAYLEEARAKGLKGVVFTDHSPMPPWYDPESRMRLEALPFYLLALERVRERAQDLYVGIGLEADFHPGTEGFLAQLLRRYPFDYVIGSVHYLGAWPLDHPDHQEEYAWRDLKEVFRAYFQEVEKAARSGLFHAIGHLDLPKKFGHRLPEEAAETLARSQPPAWVYLHGITSPQSSSAIRARRQARQSDPRSRRHQAHPCRPATNRRSTAPNPAPASPPQSPP